MQYKMVAVDMDGTLLDSNKLIPQENIDALFQLKDKGIKVVFSTGRIIESAMSYAHAIGFEPDYVTANGATIAYDDTFLHLPIQYKDVVEYALESEALGVGYNIITEDHTYYYKTLKFYDTYYYDNPMVQNSRIISKSLFDGIEEIREQLTGETIIKMDFYSQDPHRFETMWQKLNHCGYNIIRPEADYIELMHRQASKGNSVNKLARVFDIATGEIIAIGDSGNDLSMFAQCGLSISMGNAREDIKKVTMMTTDTNDNSGVAKALRKLKLI
ncbi:HAD family phosphatase [Alkalibacter rhizosphaerae]|uniref:HAD family phosphatase n=1 Tax=Alkalibacter rhizosphaerae TaxID=2815577 RepID=A0A975AH08_9FIRM|nr:Cof-type HAD-IIB family hydrolase [Alkalibacter rhizosphaerae]QSX08119.1 HAD family phosphatase [Alkalibacter rhizosphaerae]